MQHYITLKIYSHHTNHRKYISTQIFTLRDLQVSTKLVARFVKVGLMVLLLALFRKKMKQASFAASVSRDDIIRGAADLGVDLDEHINFVISHLQPIAEELDLLPVTGTSSPEAG